MGPEKNTQMVDVTPSAKLIKSHNQHLLRERRKSGTDRETTARKENIMF